MYLWWQPLTKSLAVKDQSEWSVLLKEELSGLSFTFVFGISEGFGEGNELKTDLLSTDTYLQVLFVIRKNYGEITSNSVTLLNKVQAKFCREIHLNQSIKNALLRKLRKITRYHFIKMLFQ